MKRIASARLTPGLPPGKKLLSYAPAMSFGPSFHDNQPITWWRRVPIYATTILAGLLVAGLIASVFLASAGVSLQPLAFFPPQFARGHLWTLVTYPFIDLPSFFTALGILCFYSWGVEIEKYLGRVRFFQLMGLLVVTEALICGLWYAAGVPAVAMGNYHLTAAVLIGFATLYPNVEFFGWIPLKWFAFVCVTLGVLMCFPGHDWARMTQLLGVCAMCFGFIRFIQKGGTVELPNLAQYFRPRPKLNVLPDVEPRERFRREPEEDASMVEIDALLDKIATSGLDSLSSRERAKLEKAREVLMKRETGKR